MAVKARATVTISRIIDISAITRYYMLQSSTAAAPAKPTTVPALIGKNLIPYPYEESRKSPINGITWTVNSDGSVTANGTATANSTFWLTTRRLVSGVSYTMSTGVTATVSGTSGCSMVVNYYKKGSSHYFAWINGLVAPRTGVFPEDGDKLACYLLVQSGATVSNVTFKPQLEIGTSATSYQRYTIPNWQLTEPSYTSGSTKTLYFVDCTEFTNGTFKYSEVSKSSSYEAAKEAYNKAQNAQNNVDSLTTRVSEAEANIELNKKSIELRATKTEVETTVNNVKVGGRNILLNSSFKENLNGWDSYATPISGSAIVLDGVSSIEHEMGVKIRRKNLVPYPYTNSTQTINGITFTVNSDGSITANGTATSSFNWEITSFSTFYLPKGNYILSGCPSGGSVKTYSLVAVNGTGISYTKYILDVGKGVTLSSSGEYWIIRIQIKSGKTVENITFKPQLELGTTATDYTPYVPDLTAVKVKRCGKNLLNQSTTALGTLAVGSSPTNTRAFEDNTWYAALALSGYYDPNNNMPEYALNGDNIKVKTSTNKALYGLSKALKCNPSTTYTLSYNMENGLTTNASGIGFYDADKKHISFAYCDSGSSFTTPSNCYWIIVCFHGNRENTYVTYSDIQLELGTTSTDYEPYKECVEYTPNADGTVEGVTSLYPNTTLTTDTEGVIIDCKYYPGAFVEKYGRQCIKFSNKDLKYNKYCMQQLIGKIEPNTQYTLSGWILSEHVIKGTTNPLLSLYTELSYDNNGIIGTKCFANIPFDVNTGTGSWKYVSTTFTSYDEASLSNALNLYFAIFMRDVIGEFYFYNLKLEKGNKATDWEPAYEDTETNIEKVAAIANSNKESISSLLVNTDSISASVSKLQTDTSESIDGIKKDISTLKHAVDVAITSEDVQIQIQNEMSKGSTKVVTNTGFTFDEDGLTINKSNSPTNTQITENGMTVNNTESGEAVLTANKDGVDAANLKATTYLIIGGRSRFENYGTNRTGCFWIGE